MFNLKEGRKREKRTKNRLGQIENTQQEERFEPNHTDSH